MAKNQENLKAEDFVDELKPGTELLQGQYRIVKFINAGGFGITYLAKNSLERDVVIKECFPGSFCRRSLTSVAARSRAHQAEFNQIVKLFVQEAKSLSRLIHPNIVGVHQVFEDNNTAYMAIDYIDGRDLLQVIENDPKSLAPDAIVVMLKKVLGAIAFVHDNGMLHRDISPDNILLTKSGDPILIDFGAARQQATVIGGKALSALRVVKDGYSPQEFYVSGSPQSSASDLYAIAATFYHLITGSPPPNSQARLVGIAQEGADPYVNLAGQVDGYTDGFLEALDKAANVLPKDRIQSAKEWLDMIGSKPQLKVVPMRGDDTSPAADAAATATSEIADEAQVPDSVTQEEKSGGNRMAMLLGTAAIIVIGVGIAVTQIGSDDAASAADAASTTSAVEETPTQQAVSAIESSVATPDLALVETSPAEDEAPTADTAAVEEAPTQQPADEPVIENIADSDVGEQPTATQDVDISPRQIIASDWEIALPFTADTTDAAGSFPQITQVSEAARSTPENAWLSEGVIIYAVNGTFVRNQSEIEAVLTDASITGDSPNLYAGARIKTDRSAPFREVTLAVPIRLNVSLADGITLSAQSIDGVWQTSVIDVPVPENGGLEVGDILLSEQSTGQDLNAARDLEATLATLAREQTPEAVFSVLRNGEETIATMSLAKND